MDARDMIHRCTIQKTEDWCRRFKVSECWVVSSSSLDKTVSATPLRPNQVALVHAADECHDETVLRIYGGHMIRVPCSLEAVLGWFE
jgi:hypothetical protein